MIRKKAKRRQPYQKEFAEGRRAAEAIVFSQGDRVQIKKKTFIRQGSIKIHHPTQSTEAMGLHAFVLEDRKAWRADLLIKIIKREERLEERRDQIDEESEIAKKGSPDRNDVEEMVR